MTRVDASIELWLVDLTTCAAALEALECDTPRLADEDRERAGAIRDPIQRRQRMAAYIALRVAIERVAGAGVRRRPLVRSPGGKPRLIEGTAQFSLSHSEGVALIGVAGALPIGVDVERAQPLKMLQHRHEELCAVGKGLGGQCVPYAEADCAIMQAWVRLEAFTKARGRALAQTLADLGLRGERRRPVPPAQLEAAARHLAHDTGLSVSDVKLPSGLHGAVAFGAGARLPLPRLLPADRAGLERVLVQPWPGLA